MQCLGPGGDPWCIIWLVEYTQIRQTIILTEILSFKETMTAQQKQYLAQLAVAKAQQHC